MSNLEGVKLTKEERIELHPWRRFFARLLDGYIIGLIITSILNFSGVVLPTNILATAIRGSMNMAILVLVEAILISKAGTTLGKYLLGIKVTSKDNGDIDLSTALNRSFRVFAIGQAFGIAYINIIANYIAYSSLTKEGITSWDSSCNTQVVFSEVHKVKYIVFVLILVIPLVNTWIEAFNTVI